MAATLEGHEERVWHVSWSPDGLLLATASSDRTVRIWQERSDGVWSEVSRLEDAHDRTIRCVEWSYCGKMVALASFDATVTIWSKRVEGATLEWELVSTLEGHENEVKGVAWNAGSTHLATCARDKSIWLWDLEENLQFELLTVLHGHAADVKAVVFDINEESSTYGDLASASYDETVKLWTSDGDDDWICYATLEGHTNTVWDLRFYYLRGETSSLLFTASADMSICAWKRQKKQEDDEVHYEPLSTFAKAHRRPVYSLDVTTDNGHVLVATAAGDNAIRLFRFSDSFDPLLTSPGAHTADVNCVRFNPQQTGLLASASDDGSVKVFRWFS